MLGAITLTSHASHSTSVTLLQIADGFHNMTSAVEWRHLGSNPRHRQRRGILIQAIAVSGPNTRPYPPSATMQLHRRSRGRRDGAAALGPPGGQHTCTTTMIGLENGPHPRHPSVQGGRHPPQACAIRTSSSLNDDPGRLSRRGRACSRKPQRLVSQGEVTRWVATPIAGIAPLP